MNQALIELVRREVRFEIEGGGNTPPYSLPFLAEDQKKGP